MVWRLAEGAEKSESEDFFWSIYVVPILNFFSI